MTSWTLSIRPAAETGLPAVDVVVDAQPRAYVADLAEALGSHLAPDRPGLLVVPVDGSEPWPADRLVAECALRTGDLLDVVTAPATWRSKPGIPGRPRAVLRVLAGPDTGRQHLVRAEAVTIGRAASCGLQLSDPKVSQRHARITFTPAPSIVDEGSANGTTVAGDTVIRATSLTWGTPVQLGETTLVLEQPEDATGAAPAVAVLRSPRFGEPLLDETIEIASPPTKQRPSPLPWTMLALPMVMGLALLATSRSPYTLVYMLAWPIMGLGGWMQQRRKANRDFAEDVAAWRLDLEDAIRRVDVQAVAQRERAAEDYPDHPALVPRVTNREPALWSRQDGAEDFLVTRVGLGPVDALLRAEVKDGGDRATLVAARKDLEERRTIEDLPVLAEPVDVLAIAGPSEDVDAVARAVLLRLCVDHSPSDLSVVAVLGSGRAHHESWLRWLPHATTRIGGEPSVAVGPVAGQRLLDQVASQDGGHGHTLCLVDENAGVPRRAVEAIAQLAEERRLHLVWLADSPGTVPAATDLLVDIEAMRLGRRDRGGLASITALDRLSLREAWRVARTMTGYVDEAAVLPADTALPEVVRLPDLSLVDADDLQAVLQRWQSRSGLRAQIGAGVDGVVTIDLREDGPHGLVAGTTGSGKSELLQSLICSLALNNPPERITFLLVDYKGGAAFRECADLPHTVGYITDLTPALVQRALTSLGAEISRREEMLGRYGVKDLVQLEREHPDVAPPSLLICVDEFAALTAEVPDFVDGMVNIAQRGRSLGMHVLLATQRPAGVVTPNIRANTDLRIALRVSSKDDSQDVIDASDAANISRRTPGRAWVRRTGHGTAELVQAAWTGAREALAGTRALVTVTPFSAAAGTARAETSGRLDPRTDLERLVGTVCRAFDASGAARPPRPWLPPLPHELLLDLTVPEVPARGPVPAGRVDDPANQRQPELVLDYPAVGHVLIYGASGSGKTEALRTVATSASLAESGEAAPLPPYIYGLDFAGGGLSVLEELPTVAGIVTEQQTGRVLRLIRVLRRTVEERSLALAATGSSDLADLERAGHPVPRVHVLVDNLPALVDMLESGGSLRRQHSELLSSILQNGRRVGVHVTATAPGRTGVPSALLSSFGSRLVLRMTTADDYMMLGVPSGVLDSETPAGQGLSGRRQLQVATVGGAGSPVQTERLRSVAELLEPLVADRPRGAVPAMPALVQDNALPAPEGATTPVGVDAETVSVVAADLLVGPTLIAGRAGTGKSSMLHGIAALARRSGTPPARILYAGPKGTDARADSYDHVAATPDDLARWLSGWQEAAADRKSHEWALVLVDDTQLWDRLSDSSDPAQGAVAAISSTVSTAVDGGPAHQVAFVVAADLDEARSRQHAPGLVQAVRRGRRGMLLQPDGVDGSVLGVTVPLHTSEPLTGRGRGLWCVDGTARVIQAVAASPDSSLDEGQ